jgi:rsbT antagonist protein RsbS
MMREGGMFDGTITVIKIRDVLMLALPADPDDATIATLQERVLAAMERHEARALILDISAVETFDSFFARVISETAQMVQLMGGRTLISGMRPAVAVTATQLGLGLKQVETALTVDQALDRVGAERAQGRMS